MSRLRVDSPEEVPVAPVSLAALAVLRGMSDPVPLAVRERSPVAELEELPAVFVDADVLWSVRLRAVVEAVEAVEASDVVDALDVPAVPVAVELVPAGEFMLVDELRFAIAEQEASMRMPLMRPPGPFIPELPVMPVAF
jgi:hypothetical protein